ncbi:MAG: histidine ammonia-lyase [bacterium]|nr:histidine ammonia-lyase [bacterium]
MKSAQKDLFVIGESPLDLEVFENICHGQISVILSESSRQKVERCDQFRQSLASSSKRIYGVNTGFGRLADTVIPLEQQTALQRNLIRSHAVGWGEPLSLSQARGMIFLRAMSLSHGFSGARVEVIEQLLWLLEENLHPFIPSRGSVGASGDLAPLSHLALVLMGEGHLLDNQGRRRPAGPDLESRGRQPLVLEAKEGLALINGTQLMNSLGLLAAGQSKQLVRWATLAAALSLEALEGSALPFGEKYHSVRPHKEIGDIAHSFRNLLQGSQVLAGHYDCPRVQDPYSVRCSPQVLGSTLGVVRQVTEVFVREAGSVTDNPVLLPEEKEVVTGGHFHGQPLAFQLDFLYQATSELANISDRRVNLLLGGNGGRLPRFLAGQPGLESGLMIAQYLTAALVTENKSKAFPAAVDSVPTSDGQEDHVSMGSVSAVKLAGVLARTRTVIAVELITAARALQFITRQDLADSGNRSQLQLSTPLNDLIKAMDKRIDLGPADRPLTEDLEIITAWMRQGEIPAATLKCLDPIA